VGFGVGTATYRAVVRTRTSVSLRATAEPRKRLHSRVRALARLLLWRQLAGSPRSADMENTRMSWSFDRTFSFGLVAALALAGCTGAPDSAVAARRAAADTLADDDDPLVGEADLPGDATPTDDGAAAASWHPNRCRSAPMPRGAHLRVDLSATWNKPPYAVPAVYASTGSSFGGYQDWDAGGLWPALAANTQILSGEFGGDSRGDLAKVGVGILRSGLRVIDIRMRYARDGWFEGATWLDRSGRSPDDTKDSIWIAGNFDGRGATDIAEVYRDGSQASLRVYVNRGGSFEPQVWATRIGQWSNSRWVAGYFNDDNITDLVQIRKDGNDNTLDVHLSTGWSFYPVNWASHDGGWMDSTEFLPADINGDGFTDVVAVWNDSGSSTSIAVYPSRGDHFDTHYQMADHKDRWINGTKWIAGDFDGDGLSDIAAVRNVGNANQLTVRRSDGTFLLPAGDPWSSNNGGWDDVNAWCSGRFTALD
jgi:hypothetical protein